jgi:hypothetical protein
MKYRGSVALHVLFVGLVLGFSGPARAYTINTTEVGKRIRWSVDAVQMQMDPEFEKFLGPGDAYASLAMGFEAWRGLPRVPDLVIRPGTPDSLGHHDGHPTNGIYLLRDWPYEAAKLAVTIVTYEMDTGRLLDADIVVNGKADFAVLDEPVKSGKAEYDLPAVLTHEAGHVLGLGESNSGQEATMWPYARPDDIDKRTLADDDEDGAITSYQSAPPPAADGCGPSTVGGRAGSRGGIALSLWMLAVIPMLRMTRRHKRQAAVGAVALLCLVLVGFDRPSAATDDANARALRVEQLVREGTRDDLAQLEAMQSSEDLELARRASQAHGVLLARPGSARMHAGSLDGSRRLGQLMGSGKALLVGRAQRTGTLSQNGLFFTEYKLTTPSGDSVLRIAGGARDGIGQRVMDAEPPPADGAELAVVQQADGTQHWAHHQAGILFGGHLGEGPALDGAL